MYANLISDAMRTAIDETKRRREIQIKYNKEHNIVPKTIKTKIMDVVTVNDEVEEKTKKRTIKDVKETEKIIKGLEEEMQKAAKELDFERAMELRDIIFEMKVS